MTRLPVIVSAVLCTMTAIQGAPPKATVPDFWYVLSAEDSPNAPGDLVRGIVIPSTATPTVQTSPKGSVISWRRLDGTSQSFVVEGVASLSFERGPLAGTTYVPFHRAKILAPDACCVCASYQHMEDSITVLACVEGCPECGCEGCICSPTYPCPGSDTGMRLKANRGATPTVTISKGEANSDLSFENDGVIAARFSGRRLDTRIDAEGVTTIDNPDSITLSGPISSRSSIVQDKARFAWVSPDASVILDQPAVMPAPALRGHTIDLSPDAAASVEPGKRRVLEPIMCKVCGTYPNHFADVERMACVPGTTSTCYRCVIFSC